MKALAWTHATLAAVLGLLLVAWLLISQRVHRESQSRARLWEESIESMKVGVALYDADDRLIGCNAAYRNLYSEIADRLVPGRTLPGADDRVLRRGAPRSRRRSLARGLHR